MAIEHAKITTKVVRKISRSGDGWGAIKKNTTPAFGGGKQRTHTKDAAGNEKSAAFFILTHAQTKTRLPNASAGRTGRRGFFLFVRDRTA